MLKRYKVKKVYRVRHLLQKVSFWGHWRVSALVYRQALLFSLRQAQANLRDGETELEETHTHKHAKSCCKRLFLGKLSSL